MSLVDLLANFGGTMSLFLGISIFSFLELVEVLIEISFLVKFKIINLKKYDFKNSKNQEKWKSLVKGVYSIGTLFGQGS